MTSSILKTVRVYVVDDQEIYGPVYQPVFAKDRSFELLGVQTNREGMDVCGVICGCDPDVLVMGLRSLTAEVCDELCEAKRKLPYIGLVLLVGFVDAEGGAQLRRLLARCKSGIALCLRQSLDSMDQLCKMASAASRGQIVLDPPVAAFVVMERSEPVFLKQLTSRELEIIQLLAHGHTNGSIAEELYIDVKTVEHHVNSIYSKMKADSEFENMHPRVSAARMYLETVGELPPVASEGLGERRTSENRDRGGNLVGLRGR